MKIIHHTDADGFAAARIMGGTMISIVDNNPQYIAYNYKPGDDTINKLTIENGELIIIVDLCASEVFEKLTRDALEKGCRIVHLDHHQSGIDYFNEHMTDLLNNENYMFWGDTRESASMLTWVYSHMSPEERRHPEKVFFDFSEDYSHFIFSDNAERYIPEGLRYINDNDIWRHALPNSKPFIAAFKELPMKAKSPYANIWEDLLSAHSHNPVVAEMIYTGQKLMKHDEKLFRELQRICFRRNIKGVEIAVINTSLFNSLAFGDIVKKVDAVCKYSYNGEYYTYTWYSDNDNGADVNELIQMLYKENPEMFVNEPGGHPHAAGCCLYKNIFEK